MCLLLTPPRSYHRWLDHSTMHRALLIVDPQYDFLPPSGSLAVAHGDTILPHVYRLLDEGNWTLVVASQDLHPRSHISFASRHGVEPFGTTTVRHPRTGEEVKQELWPDHCVEGTRGAELDEGVRARLGKWGERGTVLPKGTDRDLDAYSAFAVPLSSSTVADRSPELSPLSQLLHEAHIDTLVVCGLATDFCVRASVLAALEAGQAARTPWKVLVVKEAVKGVHPDEEERVLSELEAAGAKVVSIAGDELRAVWKEHT
ncbi:hypothetical protein JCM1840_006074 [Sporobolomyces johnsonii]